jgi:hypothetical protein
VPLARVTLQAELEKIRSGVVEAVHAVPQFHAHAATVFDRKVQIGRIRSASGRAKWDSILERHLYPAFGPFYVDQIRSLDIKEWQTKVGAAIKRGEMSPNSANTILSVLEQIINEAVNDYDLKNPLRGILRFDTREHHTYTEEEPNALAPADVPRFLAQMFREFPEHYAFTFMGFCTGLRPSSMRPLRREGPSADLKWDDSLLIIRRSQTLGDEVMDTTKTDHHQRLSLPRPMMAVLRWHVDNVIVGQKMRMSELLFPAVTGGFRSRSCLDKPFQAVATAIELPYRITPRGMRRTYQDLARAAGIHDTVTRAISGHLTEEMQAHYSTASAGEVRGALARISGLATKGEVIDLSAVRRRKQVATKAPTPGAADVAPLALASGTAPADGTMRAANANAIVVVDQTAKRAANDEAPTVAPTTGLAPSGDASGDQPRGRSSNYGAGEGIRTLDVNLGKVALYH